MENKLAELKNTNNLLQNRIRSILAKTYNSKSFNNNNGYDPEVNFHLDTDSTSTNILKLKSGMISGIISDEYFNRIVCLSGKIKINFIPYKEEKIITPLNTQLIIPDTKYFIEVLEDSEIISIYKPAKRGVPFKIMEQETIYNKKTINHE